MNTTDIKSKMDPTSPFLLPRQTVSMPEKRSSFEDSLEKASRPAPTQRAEPDDALTSADSEAMRDEEGTTPEVNAEPVAETDRSDQNERVETSTQNEADADGPEQDAASTAVDEEAYSAEGLPLNDPSQVAMAVESEAAASSDSPPIAGVSLPAVGTVPTPGGTADGVAPEDALASPIAAIPTPATAASGPGSSATGMGGTTASPAGGGAESGGTPSGGDGGAAGGQQFNTPGSGMNSSSEAASPAPVSTPTSPVSASAGAPVTPPEEPATSTPSGPIPLPIAAAGSGDRATPFIGPMQNTPADPAIATTSTAGNTTAGQPLVSPENDQVNAARLERGLRNAVTQQGGAVTLRLTPPELGTVRIQLQIEGSTVVARFQAESDQARGLLQQHLGQLRGALEAQGLTVDRLTVSNMNGGQSSTMNNNTRGDPDQGNGQAADPDGRNANGGEQRRGDSNGGNADDRGRGMRDRVGGEGLRSRSLSGFAAGLEALIDNAAPPGPAPLSAQAVGRRR